MKLLIDTHVAIWFATKPGRIGEVALEMILDPRNKAYVSAVSIWEIGIKYPLSKRRGAVPFSAHEAILAFQQSGFTLLDITPEHAATV